MKMQKCNRHTFANRLVLVWVDLRGAFLALLASAQAKLRGD
jgi:hypothetical protein